MISLVETGLMNALVAIGLALPLLILGRWWQRPALIHAFWILVLLKLVSPPLYEIQLPWLSSGENQSATIRSAPLSEHGYPAIVSSFGSFLTWSCQQAWYGIDASLRLLHGALVPLACLWLAGSVCWFVSQGWRIVRFAQVFLRSAQPGPDSLQQQADVLARRMGLPRSPAVWLLPAVVSPMLWSVGGRPRILFPSGLLHRLDDSAVATLLTHELAHYRRGDHRVRWLEFVVSGLFWWHPVVWVARRELEISEEHCCDAWVVSQFPSSPRRYADALLATVDFLAEEHLPLPATACGVGNVPQLRQRLRLIMRGTAPKSLSFAGRLLVIAAALLVPMSPTFSKPRSEQTAPRNPAVGAIVVAPASAKKNLAVIQSRAAEVKQKIESLTRAVASTRWRRHAETPLDIVDLLPNTPEASLSSGGEAVLSTNPVSPSLVCEPASPREVWAMATSPDGLARIVAKTDGIVEWQRAGEECVVDLSLYGISTVVFAADSQTFLGGCRDGMIRVWRTADAQLLYKLQGHQASVRAIALSSDGARLASADQRGTIRLWQFSSLEESTVVTQSALPVNSLAFSPDGQTLAFASGSWFSGGRGHLQVWDLCTASRLGSLNSQTALATVRFSPDGQFLTGAEWDGTLLTWDVTSCRLLSKRQINKDIIPAATFAPQSGMLPLTRPASS